MWTETKYAYKNYNEEPEEVFNGTIDDEAISLEETFLRAFGYNEHQYFHSDTFRVFVRDSAEQDCVMYEVILEKED